MFRSHKSWPGPLKTSKILEHHLTVIMLECSPTKMLAGILATSLKSF